MSMIKKRIILMSMCFLLAGGVWIFAQYNNSQSDSNTPPNLYPQPGPGELLIVDQLKETNRQLQEQTRLLTEQNRILAETLEQTKKQEAANKTRSK
jgi:hypothetical protein